MMIDINFLYKELTEFLQKEAPFIPDLSIILGSGLGDFANSIKVEKSFLTKELKDFPGSTVEGHEGKIHFAEFAGTKLLLFQGRIHFYEGYRLSQCILPVHIAHKLGCKKLLLTNAAGGINPNLFPGSLMLNNSFVSNNIKKELTDLIGLASIEAKNNFLHFPSFNFNNMIKTAALEEKIKLSEGVYWYTKGPSYETPAEVKMISKFGGDAVGMSTVHEAIYAANAGMDVSSLSCITNFAAGISAVKLSHEDVTFTANRVKDTFERLVKRIINLINM